MNKKIISIILATILFILTSSFTLAEAVASANVENGFINVALNKNVTLTTGSEHNGNLKERLVDGTALYAEIMYDGVNTDVGYIVDLGKDYNIKQFKVQALANNDSGRDKIRIDVSKDNNEWINILTRNDNETDEFSKKQKTSNTLVVDAPEDSFYRYVKLSAYAYGVWHEFEVYAKMPQLISAEKINKNIYLEFDEKMDAESITTESLNVYEGENTVSYTASVHDNMVVLSFDKVVDDANYSIKLTDGVKSVFGDGVITDGEKISVIDILTVNDFSLSRSLRKASASAVVKNNADTAKKISLIAAQYSPTGMLEEIDICTKELLSGISDSFEAVINSETDFDVNTTLKAFIWNVTDNKMIPLVDDEQLQGMITELYVSPEGNDDAKGTFDAPFATIERAMTEVNHYNADMNHDITVYLMEGVHQLDDTLVFDENDGGSNGYNVIYKAYPGDEAIISGGVPVTEWTQDEKGIWYADVAGIDSALVMSVNGIAARRAQSEEWIDILSLFPEERLEDTKSGLTVVDTKYAQYKNQSDIQLRFSRGWKSYLLNVDSITVDENGSKFFMRQPSFYFAEYNKLSDAGYETHYYNIADNNNFKIENAFEELDTKGEFYYNNNGTEKRIYYIPRDGENLLTADVRIAKLDKLIEIDGFDNANKVKNLVFEDLIFSDGAWSRASEYGFVSDQAQMLVYDPEISTENPGYTLSPGNILVNRAENIRFENNIIRNMGAGGIYFYKGVDNSKIIGNAFYDIGDSAVIVSSPEQVYNEKIYLGKNLAAGKSAIAGSITGEYYTPERAFDSNTRTLWAPRLNGNSWIQVDLEEAYEIDRVELDYRTDGGYKSFNGVIILASNDPEFKTNYTQLTATVTSNDNGVIYSISDTEKYRYIRFKHTNDTGYWVLPEARIINESMDYVSSTDICDNNLINNNYITRVGKTNSAAPGIQLYYVQDTEISNNYVYEVPYTGIALGWGWSSYKDSDTCGDNSILNNKIEKSMLQSFDGGGIYICGQQYGDSIISGNHITDSINGGGIYLDTYSSNNDIKNNVIENTLESFCAPADSFDNKWSNNYVSSVMTTVSVNNGNVFEKPNAFIKGDYPDAAVQIVKNAGLTDEYKHLVQLSGENLYPLTVTEYYNNMLHDEDNHHILPKYLKKIYNTSFVDSVNKWIEIASEVGYNVDAIDKLQTVVDSIVDSNDRAVIFEQCNTLRNAMDEFASNIK